MRHTKIIATIGPATSSADVIERLIDAGVDICRLNFSHGTRETQTAMFKTIRAAAAKTKKVVAILQDLSGPKIRTGRLKDGLPVELKPGQTVRIAAGDRIGNANEIYTTYDELLRSVRAGSRLLIDDGRIQLEVTDVLPDGVVAKVIEGGTLGEHKGINAPGVPLGGSALTPKDIEDLHLGLELGVDMVALSFVRSGNDLRQARKILLDAGAGDTPLVAKLERPEALDHIDEILKESDAVMVARGDLGLEIPLEMVPSWQKDITRRARKAGVPVIVATQVLESMRSGTRPTRAEVSDAANAVDDGVDAIMLAGETAIGLYPLKTVVTLDAIIREAERIAFDQPSNPVMPQVEFPRAPHLQPLCEAAVTLADHTSAYAIVAITRQGNSARVLSALRPRTPVFAATEKESVARHLTMYRGVHPLPTGIGKDTDASGARLREDLRAHGLVPPGAVVVFMSANARLDRAELNFVNVQKGV